MPDTKTDTLIHVPVLDKMRSDLDTWHVFEESLGADEFKSLINSSVDGYLRTDSSVSLSRDLNIELEGQQAYINGTAQVRKAGATVDINIADYSLRQDPDPEQKGRLSVIDLKYDFQYSGNVLTDLVADPEKMKKDFESALRDPNRFIYKGITQQLPPGTKLKNFGLFLENGKFRIKLEA